MHKGKTMSLISPQTFDHARLVQVDPFKHMNFHYRKFEGMRKLDKEKRTEKGKHSHNLLDCTVHYSLLNTLFIN
jgi:hypothetical protein